MLGNPWYGELGRLAGVAFAGFLGGLYSGRYLAAMLLAVLAYLGWQLYHLYRLEHWLRVGKRRDPPAAWGLWGEVYHHFYRLQQRNRKRKRKLASYLKRFQQSTAAMPDGTVVLDADGRIEWLNGAAAKLLGLRSPQDVGQRIGNFLRQPAFLEFLAESGDDEPLELPAPKDPEIRLSLRLIRYGKSQHLLLVRDVTRVHRLEAMRRDFVANVSHELRTPLTVISGYLETMLDGVEEYPPAWGRSLQSMQDQAWRMRRLVDDLLLLSRLETAEEPAPLEEVVAVPAMIAAVEEDARLRSAGRHAIIFEVDARVWLKGDAEQIRSVFSNLVHNAVQYTPEGESIAVRWYLDEAGAHFEVKDTGVGIAQHHISRLTERFYRVDVGRSRERGGTGLGLAIVKHGLNRHDGELRVQSRLGQGSTFVCDFPPERVVVRERPVDGPVGEQGGADIIEFRGIS